MFYGKRPIGVQEIAIDIRSNNFKLVVKLLQDSMWI